MHLLEGKNLPLPCTYRRAFHLEMGLTGSLPRFQSSMNFATSLVLSPQNIISFFFTFVLFPLGRQEWYPVCKEKELTAVVSSFIRRPVNSRQPLLCQRLIMWHFSNLPITPLSLNEASRGCTLTSRWMMNLARHLRMSVSAGHMDLKDWAMCWTSEMFHWLLWNPCPFDWRWIADSPNEQFPLSGVHGQ